MRRTTIAFLAAVFLTLGACERQASSPPAPVEVEDAVRATTPPMGWMAQRIAGDLVPVEMLCPAGQDPATWRPGPEIVAQYQRAQLIIANGAQYELWIVTAPLPRSRMVRTADAIEGELLVVKGEAHSHGPEGTHAHDVVDGHTWLDPINAIAQSQAIADALADAFPEHADAFAQNHASLAAELQGVHEHLASLDLSAVAVIAPERPFGYLARRYAWPTVRVGDDPAAWGTELESIGVSALLGEQARGVLLCEEAPGPAIAKTLLETHGIQAVRWDTGESLGDVSYADLLKANLERLESAIAELSP